jgi:hypothetical protein
MLIRLMLSNTLRHVQHASRFALLLSTISLIYFVAIIFVPFLSLSLSLPLSAYLFTKNLIYCLFDFNPLLSLVVRYTYTKC